MQASATVQQNPVMFDCIVRAVHQASDKAGQLDGRIVFGAAGFSEAPCEVNLGHEPILATLHG